MNREELITRLKNVFTQSSSSAPGLDAAWIMQSIDEYVQSQQPAKEVVPAEDEEQFKAALYQLERGSSVEVILDDSYKISMGAGQFRRVVNAMINGFTIKAEPKYRVLAPKEWMPGDKRAFATKPAFGGIGWSAARDIRNKDKEFTMDEIEKYHLCDFEREEVKEDE